eukprot:Partr_v1_DN25178_c1_g1_i1_m76844 putative Zinc binding alcohol dehydrogenase, domain containing 2
MTKSGTYKKLSCIAYSTDFDKATEIKTCQESDLTQSLPAGSVIVRVEYVGMNASDINFTAGRYQPDVKPPFDVGFEGCGVVVMAGSEVTNLSVGQPVMFMTMGAFTELISLPATGVVPIPAVDPKYMCGLVVGLTAVLALEQGGGIKQGNTVLITAAAGGVGQIAVQWAKRQGAHVIGTCSTADKCRYLESIGCDTAINYREQDVNAELKAKFPRGIDIILESVGGRMLEMAVARVAVRGTIIVIGSISNYKRESSESSPKFSFGESVATDILLTKSATVRGFFLSHYPKEIAAQLPVIIGEIAKGTIQARVDLWPHTGIEHVRECVEHLHAGKNTGKVVARLQSSRAASPL